jgi:hypothetical protein
VPFGILPGGSEEIVLSEAGKENVFVKNREACLPWMPALTLPMQPLSPDTPHTGAGFIKYALEYGYTIAIGYTFGESDNYTTFPYFKATRLRILKMTKFIPFLAWGKWYCPVLPRNDHPLNTVIGNPIHLPKISKPTTEDVEKYHAIYIEKLVDLFERNKARFGYGDRTLNLY